MLEGVGEFAHHALAFGNGARRRFLLIGLEPFKPHQIVAEGLRRPRRVADFVAAAGIGDIELALAVRQLQQNAGNVLDRPTDRQYAENRRSRQDDDDKKSESHADLRGLRAARRRRGHALRGECLGVGSRLRDQGIDLGADFADRTERLVNIRVLFFQRRHLGGVGGAVFGQGDEPVEAHAIFRVAAQLHGSQQITDGLAHAVAQAGEGLIGLPLGNGQADFARAGLHPLQVDAGAQHIGGDELFVALQFGVPRYRGVADLLVGDHAGHEHDADADRDGELGADADVEPGQHGREPQLAHRAARGMGCAAPVKRARSGRMKVEKRECKAVPLRADRPETGSLHETGARQALPDPVIDR